MSRTLAILRVAAAVAASLVLAAGLRPAAAEDARNLRTGPTIPDKGRCDQPYIVIAKDGNRLCTLTTGRGKEGEKELLFR